VTAHALRQAAWMLLPALAPVTVVAQPPNAERGRLLYENHCQVCHTPKIHTRANRLPIDAADLREIVTSWQRAENLRWRSEDIEDVVEFLRQTRYRF
jgi:mono/diheme cytochrome c family protein